MLRVLVAGLLGYDSGKTWLSLALARLAGSAALYKPVGGFDAWYSREALAASRERRILLGMDAHRFSEASGEDPLAVNPAAYAAAPMDPLAALRAPARYEAAMASVEARLAIWRLPMEGCGDARHWFSAAVLAAAPPPVARELRGLAEALGAEEGDPGEALRWLNSREAGERLDECRERLEARARREVVIVESHSDAPLPHPSMDACVYDFYVVAAPGRALVYSGEKLCRALEVAAPARVQRLLPYLGRPLEAPEVPPAGSPEELAGKLSSRGGLLGLLAGLG